MNKTVETRERRADTGTGVRQRGKQGEKQGEKQAGRKTEHRRWGDAAAAGAPGQKPQQAPWAMASARPYKLSDRGIRPSEVNRKYLHTNSTSHTWPFSAFAELIDNAYDPDVGAKQIWIDKTVISGEQCLMFSDNGKGMCHDKLHKMLSFGFCEKTKVDNHVPIGMYGNGFKSGSMRLGRDALVFTKNATHMSVGMLSQSYLEAIDQETIIVPIAVWGLKDRKLELKEDCQVSLKDILQYSLFRSEAQLLTELAAIQTRTGTKIIIWNLHRNRGKSLELDFDSDKYDILIPHDVVEEQRGTTTRQSYGGLQRQMPDSEYSLRAYCSILYLKPRTQVILRGAKVKTQLIAKSLAHIDYDIYQPQFLSSGKKKVKVTFGLNCKSQVHYGIMMYHHNRLIKAYERTKCQLQVSGVGEGVIGIIECDFLKPTHNKQDFDQTNEYRLTLSAVDRKLQEYWRDRSDLRVGLVDSTFNSKDLIEKPDQIWVQCDGCLKWRKLPDDIGKLPDKWYCQLNPDPQYRTCDVLEEPEDMDEVDIHKKNLRRRELREKAERQLLKAKLEKEALQRKLKLALEAKQAKEPVQTVPPLVISTVTNNSGKPGVAVMRIANLTVAPPPPPAAAAPAPPPVAPAGPLPALGGAVRTLMHRVVQEAAFLRRENQNLKRLTLQGMEAGSTALAEITWSGAQQVLPSCQGLRISDVKSLSVNGGWQQASPIADANGARAKRKLEMSGAEQAKRPRPEPAGSAAASNGAVSSSSASTFTVDDDDVICLDEESPRVPPIDTDLRKVKQEAARAPPVSSQGVQTVTTPFRCKEEDGGDAGTGDGAAAVRTGTAGGAAGGAAGAVAPDAVAPDAGTVAALRRENERLQSEVRELQQQLLSRTLVKDEEEEEERKERPAEAGGQADDGKTAPADVAALHMELEKLREDARHQAKEWETVVNHLMREIEDSALEQKQVSAENQRLSEECARLRGQKTAAAETGTNTEAAGANTEAAGANTEAAGANTEAGAAGVDGCLGPDAASETTTPTTEEDGRKLQAELDKAGAELQQLQREKVQLEAQEAQTAIYLSQGMSDRESLVTLRQNVVLLLQNLIPKFQMPDDPSLVDDIVPQLLRSTSL